MDSVDIDLISDFREKNTFSPSLLLLTFPHENSTKNKQFRANSAVKFHPHQQEIRQRTPRIANLNVNNSNVRDSLLLSSYNWLRRTERVEPITPAPDLTYRYSYMEKPKRKKSAPMHHSCLSPSRSSSSAHNQHAQKPLSRSQTTATTSSYNASDSSQRQYPQQYRSAYEYILHSIKEIERKRNLKQENFSKSIKRPQNNDVILQRALSARKHSSTTKVISISEHDLLDTQNFTSYINPSGVEIRVSRTRTPNQLNQS